MKALVLKKFNEFAVEDIAIPEIGANDVLIKIMAAAICGSDVHGMDGSTGRRIPPVVMGHEASGIIEKKGANVIRFNVGDRVTFDSTIYCKDCYYCRRGKINLCENRRVLGVSCNEYRQNGAFAEYAVVPQHILYAIPDLVSYERAAMVEPLSIAVHAVNMTSISVNDTAVVMGTGMIGLLVIQVLKLSSCGRIIAVDIDQSKLDLSMKFGADIALNAAAKDVQGEILKATQGRGADIAFEVVGITKTIQSAVACLRKGGKLTLVGNLSPMVEMPLQSIVTREISMNGSCASAGEYDICLDLIAKGAIDVDAFISAVISLEQGAEYFQRLYDKEPGLMKVIIKP
jgi:L-iditol 2-dehydrogenase